MIQAKGRNGYFKVDHITIFPYKESGKPVIDIAFYSKSRLAKAPPMRIMGTRKEIVRLLDAIRGNINKAILADTSCRLEVEHD